MEKEISEMRQELQKIENENKVYKEYADGKLAKNDLDRIIQMTDFDDDVINDRLRKIRVNRLQYDEENDTNFGVQAVSGHKVNDLVKFFSGSLLKDKKASFERQKTRRIELREEMQKKLEEKVKEKERLLAEARKAAEEAMKTKKEQQEETKDDEETKERK